MADQYDVFQVRPGQFAVIVQSSLFATSRTRVVVPALPARAAGPGADSLGGRVSIGGRDLQLLPLMTTTLDVEELGYRVGNVGDQEGEVRRALEMLIEGV